LRVSVNSNSEYESRLKNLQQNIESQVIQIEKYDREILALKSVNESDRKRLVDAKELMSKLQSASTEEAKIRELQMKEKEEGWVAEREYFQDRMQHVEVWPVGFNFQALEYAVTERDAGIQTLEGQLKHMEV
jgi:hypothetical protein